MRKAWGLKLRKSPIKKDHKEIKKYSLYKLGDKEAQQNFGLQFFPLETEGRFFLFGSLLKGYNLRALPWGSLYMLPINHIFIKKPFNP